MVTRAIIATGLLGVALGMVLSLVPAQTAVAATGINKHVNFQGKLVNTDGTNVTNGTNGTSDAPGTVNDPDAESPVSS